MSDQKVSVIVVTYNSAKDIVLCLKSLVSQTYQQVDLLIVDNASQDNTVNLVKKQFPQVKIIENKKNSGFAKANNQGIKKALLGGSSIAVLLNPDTRVDNNFVEVGVNFLKTHHQVAAASPTIVYASKPDKIWYVGAKIWRGTEILKQKSLKFGEHVDKRKELTGKHQCSQKTDWATGCALFIPKNSIEEIGYLEESLFMYGEDVDFSLRAQKMGKEIWYFSGTKVYHDEAWKRSRHIFRPILLKLIFWKIRARLFILWHYFTKKEIIFYFIKVLIWPIRYVAYILGKII